LDLEKTPEDGRSETPLGDVEFFHFGNYQAPYPTIREDKGWDEV
jgi:hypothetical protein